MTLQQALVAHQRTAQSDKVRVRDELKFQSTADKTFSVVPAALNYPDHDQVDRIALGREITRFNQERVKLEAELDVFRRSKLHRFAAWLLRLTRAA